MIYHPRILSLLLSLAIAATTGALMWLVVRPERDILLAVFVIAFISAYLFVNFIFSKFIFRELRRIESRLRSFGVSDDEPSEVRTKNPFQFLLQKIEAVVEDKRKEIDRLKKLEAFRKDFIADVSHELKTPIFAAQGFVHTLLDGAVKEKAVRNKFLKKAAKSLDGLDMLVQDLLTLSQIETGQIKMRFAQFDLYALTEEVFEQFKGKVNKKDIVLRIDGAARKVMAYGDSLRIGQVLTNLISNAIKHSPDGSEVIVSFSVRGPSVVTYVRDFGEGIAEEHLHRVFERFYRVDKSRSREKGGTGLGLAIVKHILDGHHTKAEVKSKPGAGSTFSFRLPREKNDYDGDRESDTSAED